MTQIETLITVHGAVLRLRCSEGWSIKQIAADLGYQRKMVGRALKRITGAPRYRGYYHYWLREQRAELVQLYNQGASTSLLGRTFGVSPHTIAAILREAGVQIRRPGGVRLYSHAKIIAGALTGQSQTQLAAQLGITRTWLSRLETAAGIPSRKSNYFGVWRQRMLAERAREAA